MWQRIDCANVPIFDRSIWLNLSKCAQSAQRLILPCFYSLVDVAQATVSSDMAKNDCKWSPFAHSPREEEATVL